MKRIKALQALSVLVLGLMSSASQAANYVKFEFTALGTLAEFSSAPGDYPLTAPGNFLNVGTAVNGYFLYDLDLAGDTGSNGSGHYGYFFDPTAITLKFTSNTGYSFAPNAGGTFDPYISIEDSTIASPDPRDKIWIGAAGKTADGALQDAELFFVDKRNAGSIFTGALPASLSLNDFDAVLTLAWTDDNGHNFRFQATVDTLKQVSAVPEPETYAMLLAGLALMGAVARRRKAA